jgi:xanthine dehydrogenase iron-sulfur cluster and FAD-binding subunit A
VGGYKPITDAFARVFKHSNSQKDDRVKRSKTVFKKINYIIERSVAVRTHARVWLPSEARAPNTILSDLGLLKKGS